MIDTQLENDILPPTSCELSQSQRTCALDGQTDLPHLEEGGAGEQTIAASLVLRPHSLQLQLISKLEIQTDFNCTGTMAKRIT